MARWQPDPTFYASPRAAMGAPAETLADVGTFDPEGVGRVDMPTPGDELHHFGWNMCSSALCPYAPHPHRGLATVATMAAIAIVVYERVGVDSLRRAWIDLDRVWAIALVAVGGMNLFP